MSVLIIAEAGVNHNGDINIARKLIDAAKFAGADIVKFQTFDAGKLATAGAHMAGYQEENLGVKESQKDMLSGLMLSREEFTGLAGYCERTGIRFLSTPFDTDSIDFLSRLQDVWKVPSGEITDYPYLVKIAQTHGEVILSTGMSTTDEIKSAIDVLTGNGAGKITLLHCTSDYPAAMKDVNLRAMVSMKEQFGCDVGYSDHTQGIEVAVAAAALGAVVIEKHFTLDRNMKGPDHKASLEPDELKRLVWAVRNIEDALGDGKKVPSGPELLNREVVRKSIVAVRDIRAGEILTEDNLTTKRPGTGIDPMRWEEVIGTKAVRDFCADEMIEI